MSQLFVILSAGEGSRLRPLTQSVPKALVEFKERKIIQRTLESCRLNGINDNQIIIITGHGADNFSSFSLPSVHNPIFYKSNMFFSLFLAGNFDQFDTVYVCYGDIIFDPDMLSQLVNEPNANALISDSRFLEYWSQRTEKYINDLETFETNDSSFLLSVGEKISNLNKVQGQFIGLMKFSGIDLTSAINSAGDEFSMKKLLNWYMTDFLRYAIAKNLLKIKVVQSSMDWIEIDTLEDFNAPISHQRVATIDAKLSQLNLANQFTK